MHYCTVYRFKLFYFTGKGTLRKVRKLFLFDQRYTRPVFCNSFKPSELCYLDAKHFFQADEIEKILCHKFMRFMMMRAESFVILRRKAMPV